MKLNSLYAVFVPLKKKAYRYIKLVKTTTITTTTTTTTMTTIINNSIPFLLRYFKHSDNWKIKSQSTLCIKRSFQVNKEQRREFSSQKGLREVGRKRGQMYGALGECAFSRRGEVERHSRAGTGGIVCGGVVRYFESRLCGVSLRPLFGYSVMFRSVGQVLCGDASDQRISWVTVCK